VAVLSHWVFDWLVHRPDLPLYDNTATVGLGLWNYVGLSLALEVLLLGGGLWLYMKRTRPLTKLGRYGPVALALFMVAIQVSSLVGPYPPSPTVVAVSGLAMYVLFAALAGGVDRGRVAVASG
jgi:hypothetical protein